MSDAALVVKLVVEMVEAQPVLTKDWLASTTFAAGTFVYSCTVIQIFW
jgi:hypothetical protein